MPVAPTGWPAALSPPEVLTARPERRLYKVANFFICLPPSPFFQKPKSSMAKISAIEKQSCNSAILICFTFNLLFAKAFSAAILVANISSNLFLVFKEIESVAISDAKTPTG